MRIKREPLLYTRARRAVQKNKTKQNQMSTKHYGLVSFLCSETETLILKRDVVNLES